MSLEDAKGAKVVVNGETIIDVTSTTATADTVAAGYSFLDAKGKATTGTYVAPLFAIDERGLVSIGKSYREIYETYLNGQPINAFLPSTFNRAPNPPEYLEAVGISTDNIMFHFLALITEVNEKGNYPIYIKYLNKDINGTGLFSQAEGYQTQASGDTSHAEGYFTQANGLAQHVEGAYNIVDTCDSQDKRANYVHIVGNGTGPESENRSNAHTLDWEGNAWYSGTVEAVNGIIIKDSNNSDRYQLTIQSGELKITKI